MHDCVICTVAMLTGWKYDVCERAARDLFYDPDKGIGMRPYDLISKLGIPKDPHWDMYMSTRDRFFYYPCIASVPSINLFEKDGTPMGHSVLLVYKRNEIHVLDPSYKTKVSLDYVFDNCKLTEALFYD